MAVKQRLYTADDLWEMTDQGDIQRRLELIRGELCEMTPAGGLSSLVTSEVAYFIRHFVRECDLGYVTSAEGGFILSESPYTVLAPDIGFVFKNRMPHPIPQKFFPFAPDFAVEIVSPSDSLKAVREKVNAYVDAGTQMIWVIYPDDQSADVYTPAEGESANLKFIESGGVLEGGDVLPGLRVSLREVFERLEES